MEGIPEGDIRVVASGLNLKDLKPAAKAGPEVFRIGYLARVCPEKGLALLAEAFHLIRSRGRVGLQPVDQLVQFLAGAALFRPGD